MPESVGVTVLDVAGRAAEVLKQRAGIPNARLEAELLLASVLGMKRLDLYLQFDRPVGAEELDRYRTLVRRRLRREPLQYIVGETGFRNLVLHVDRRVLIPRPETEVLVGEVLAWAKPRSVRSALDIGTGSGAIAICLAHEGKLETVIASDASEDALEVARMNALRTGVAARVEFRHGDLWQAVRQGERFDIIVSNPPYIAEAERPTLAPEVVDWEPARALFAPDSGLGVLRAIVEEAPEHLEPRGLVAVEVGLGQAKGVAELARQHGGYQDVRVITDLTGRERIVLAERN